jgi:hypothetical protein
VSEVVNAILKGSDPEDVAKLRLEVIESYDLYRRGSAELDEIVIRERGNHMDAVDLAKVYMRWWGGLPATLFMFANDFLGRCITNIRRSRLVAKIVKAIREAKYIDQKAALGSPLVFSILYTISPNAVTQMIHAISGLTGVGKTTLVYNSVKIALQALGLSEGGAKELFLASYIQLLEEFAAFLKLLDKKNTRAPIVVLDDAAATLSAYIWFTKKRSRAIQLAKFLTVARERISSLIVVGPYRMIFRGVRRIVHFIYEPETWYLSLPDGNYTVALWHVISGGDASRRVVDMTATVAPHPMRVDDDVYQVITYIKGRIWREVVGEAWKWIRSSNR